MANRLIADLIYSPMDEAETGKGFYVDLWASNTGSTWAGADSGLFATKAEARAWAHMKRADMIRDRTDD